MAKLKTSFPARPLTLDLPNPPPLCLVPQLPYLAPACLVPQLPYLAVRLSCIFGENTSPRSARSTSPTARAVAASRAPSLR
jgi:hypothetical protein